MTPSSKHARRFGARTLTLASLSLTAFAQAGLQPSSEPIDVEVLPSAPTPARTVAPEVVRLAIDDERLSWDRSPEGVVWVRGYDFKASFGPAGVSVAPFLGSDAPRNYPVTFTLASASIGGVAIDVEQGVEALHAGANVRFERGAIVESYDLDARSIEQSFDLHAPVGVGDLSLRIAFESELVAQQVNDGIVFRNDRGGLDYSHAVAIDARGEQVEMPATLVDGAIEIVVPESFLANAAYPVRVDPTFTVSGVSVNNHEDLAPELTYDHVTRRSLIVFVRRFSGLDNDAAVMELTPQGTVIGPAYMDISFDDWTAPRVASQRALGRYLVVARRRPQDQFDAHVYARVVQTGLTAITAPFPVSAIEPGFIGSIDVGGSRDDDVDGKFLVAWTHEVSGVPSRLRLRVVTADGALQGASAIEFSEAVSYLNPCVAQASHDGQWSFLWERESSPTNHDLMFGRVRTDSTVAHVSFFTISSVDERRPSLSTTLAGSNRYAVAYERRTATSSRIDATLMDGLTPLATYTVTDIDGTFATSAKDPQVECDGTHFLFGYTLESDQPALRVSEMYVTPSDPPQLGLVGSAQVDFGITGRSALSSLHAAGVVSRELGLMWSRLDNLWIARVQNTEGGPYGHVCFGDGSGGACPCANYGFVGRGCANSANSQGALLSGSGAARIGGDTLLLSGLGMPPGAFCVYLQGTLTAAPATAFGDGLRCATGAIVRLGTKQNDASGASRYPGAGDASVSVRGGLPPEVATRSYQIWYRNAAGFCTSSTFNLSNGLVATFAP